ncbi:MAG: hypothetical protein OXE40_01475, partial [Gammaproteobacteria bacterium]|nr:hypothetical protein [Gammaproteobacteria bacterium]
MKKLIAVLTLGALTPFVLAAELSVSGTPEYFRSIFPDVDGERVTSADLIACSQTDPTDLLTCIDAKIAAVAGGGGEANERVLMAVGRQTSTSGVTSLTLPADYTDFEHLELIVSDPGSGTNTNTADTVRIETAWLAAQNDADAPKLAVLDTDEAGSRQWLTWTPSTRLVSRGVQTGQTVRVRIQAARLYDGGGSGGDGLTEEQAAKLARYPENPGATPAAHLEPFELVGAYATVSYNVATFGTFGVDAGEVMLSPAETLSGETRRGVMIGLRPEDSDAIAYAEVGLTLRLLTESNRAIRVEGTAASVSNHAGETVLLVSLRAPTVNSDGAGVAIDIDFANKIETRLRNNGENISAVEVTQQNLRNTLQSLSDALPTPVVPATASEAKRYELLIPPTGAGSTRAQWAEAAGSTSDSSADQTARDDAAEALNAAAAARTTATSALERTQRLRPISQWTRWEGPQTILLEWKPVGPVTSGASLSVNISGTPVTGVTAPEAVLAGDTQGTVLSIPVPSAGAANIDRATNTGLGHVEVQI